METWRGGGVAGCPVCKRSCCVSWALPRARLCAPTGFDETPWSGNDDSHLYKSVSWDSERLSNLPKASPSISAPQSQRLKPKLFSQSSGMERGRAAKYLRQVRLETQLQMPWRSPAQLHGWNFFPELLVFSIRLPLADFRTGCPLRL